MKRRGVLNAPLSARLAELGHTDLVVVGDAGLPRPAGVPVVDLALVLGVPSFADVVRALADELTVEQVTMADEARTANAGVVELVRSLFGEPEWVVHEQLKAMSGTARLFVRTGEATPFANVVLRCGVPF